MGNGMLDDFLIDTGKCDYNVLTNRQRHGNPTPVKNFPVPVLFHAVDIQGPGSILLHRDLNKIPCDACKDNPISQGELLICMGVI
jgi:hypothetical protein